MKILLLGEFSGFYFNLKKGFKSLGHEVCLIAGSDGWKNIPGTDISLNSNRKGLIRKIDLFFKYCRALHKMKGFDVVLIINPGFIKPFFTYVLPFFLKMNNKKIYMSACGDDFEYLSAGKKGYLKHWFYEIDELRGIYPEKPSLYSERKHNVILKYIDGVIPICFDYQKAWLHSKYSDKLKPIIKLPLSEGNFNYSYPDNDKINILYGVNRLDVKGGQYVMSALRRIELDFPEIADVRIVEKLPFLDYVKVIETANIVIDQCKVYNGMGMNALLSMAKGKVVVTSLKDELREDPILKSCPVIDISSDEDYIYEVLKELIINKVKLKEISQLTYNYTLENHSSIKVARQYIEAFDMDA